MTDGVIFDVKRFSVHDGPGIRTTIFFKGCPLVCWWCHNPESLSADPQRSIRHLTLEGKLFEREEITGYKSRVDELLAEVEQDRVFYEESGGGVTLSGGEPLYQPDFCEELLRSLKKQGFHTALDTSGYSDGSVIDRMIPFTDLFMFDLKLMDDNEHIKYTGVSNQLILENLKRLLENWEKVIIRFPVIPGITDRKDNIDKLIAFLAERRQTDGQAHKVLYERISAIPLEVHLLPYHNIARNKYRRLRMKEKVYAVNEPSVERLAELSQQFAKAGFRVTTGG